MEPAMAHGILPATLITATDHPSLNALFLIAYARTFDRCLDSNELADGGVMSAPTVRAATADLERRGLLVQAKLSRPRSDGTRSLDLWSLPDDAEAVVVTAEEVRDLAPRTLGLLLYVRAAGPTTIDRLVEWSGLKINSVRTHVATLRDAGLIAGRGTVAATHLPRVTRPVAPATVEPRSTP
jgi:DNA-binding IclR family transcriptional regulator